MMGRGLRWARKLLGVVVVAGALGACESPTLPLPPPAVPTVSSQGLPQGEVKLTSHQGAEPNAIIVIYNANPSLPLDKRVGGAQADGQGSWDAIVNASSGDVLDIRQEFGATRSPPTTVQVP